MELVNIYTLVGCPVLGDIGPNSVICERIVCHVCEREIATEYDSVEYVFDDWNGEDLITARRVYLVTDRLRKAMQSRRLSGMVFGASTVTPGSLFPEGKSLQKFSFITPEKEIEGEGWWRQAGVCENCGQPIWEPTSAVYKGQAARVTHESAPTRNVYAEEWSGQDFFFLPEPGPPIVTQRFVEVLQGLAVKDVILQPADWIHVTKPRE